MTISEKELIEGLVAGLTAERAALRGRLAHLEARGEPMDEHMLSNLQNLKINLNDRVRFRIRPGQSKLFDDEPEVKIEKRCTDGSAVANAQLHALFSIVGPELRPWLKSPIDSEIEVILEPKA